MAQLIKKPTHRKIQGWNTKPLSHGTICDLLSQEHLVLEICSLVQAMVLTDTQSAQGTGWKCRSHGQALYY